MSQPASPARVRLRPEGLPDVLLAETLNSILRYPPEVGHVVLDRQSTPPCLVTPVNAPHSPSERFNILMKLIRNLRKFSFILYLNRSFTSRRGYGLQLL